MMKGFESKFQIGKNGLTDTVLQNLETHLKTHRQVRISVLKSASRDKDEVKTLAQELVKKIPFKTDFKIIGFTIILMKFSNSKKEKETKPL